MENQKDCIFCKIIAKKIPSEIVYEDENVIGILDINPVSKGHILIIPKQHVSTVEDCYDLLLMEIIKVAKKISSAVTKAMFAQGFNIVINNRKAAGQLIEHLHLHIIPRNENDGLTIDKQKTLKYDELETKKIAEKIRNLLK